MPYAQAFRKDRRLQKAKRKDQFQSAFESPMLAALASVFSAQPNGRSAYPDLLMFATAAGIRAWPSMSEGLETLSPKRWASAIAAYDKTTGNRAPLPTQPPTMRQIDAWYARSLPKNGAQAALDIIAAAYMDAAVDLAKSLGQFPAGVTKDFTTVDHRHIVLGDGSFMTPWSSAQYVVDPESGEMMLVGSRATVGKPRVATTLTDPTPDDKTSRGINQVTLSTWTQAGWVILGAEPALGAEVYAAIRLIDNVAARLGDGMHVVVWDRVLTGHHIADILNKHGALVINKNVAREKVDAPKGSRGAKKRSSTYPRLSKKQAVDLHTTGLPLPLGTSVYETAKGYEMVRGHVYHLGAIPADIACAHDLRVDDGALVDVSYDQAAGYEVKVAHATAITSTVEPVHGGHLLVTEWRLPCVNDPGIEHEFTTVWNATEPLEGRGGRRRAALAAARPVPRLDTERFPNIHGLRNITESINAWIKKHLSPTGRAGHLHYENQVLDHLLICYLSNAGTARRARLLNLIP